VADHDIQLGDHIMWRIQTIAGGGPIFQYLMFISSLREPKFIAKLDGGHDRIFPLPGSAYDLIDQCFVIIIN